MTMEYKSILCTVLGFYTPPIDGKQLIINYGKLVHEAKRKPNDILANSESFEVSEAFEFIPMQEFVNLIEGQYKFIKSLITEGH